MPEHIRTVDRVNYDAQCSLPSLATFSAMSVWSLGLISVACQPHYRASIKNQGFTESLHSNNHEEHRSQMLVPPYATASSLASPFRTMAGSSFARQMGDTARSAPTANRVASSKASKAMRRPTRCMKRHRSCCCDSCERERACRSSTQRALPRMLFCESQDRKPPIRGM